MNCPVCTDVDLAMTDLQGVEIDYCPKCRGIWLDRGELDKIIERSASHQNTSYTSQNENYKRDKYKKEDYSKDRYSDDYKYHKKRKKKDSFLEDLFDFDF